MSVAPVSLKHGHRLNASRHNLDGSAHACVRGFLSECVVRSFSFLCRGSCRDHLYFEVFFYCMDAFRRVCFRALRGAVHLL